MPNDKTLKLTGSSSAKHLYMKSLENLSRITDNIKRDAIAALADPDVQASLMHEFDEAYLEVERRLQTLHENEDFTEREYAERTGELDKIHRHMQAAFGARTTMYGRRRQKVKCTKKTVKRTKKTVIDRAQNMITSDKRGVLRRLTGKEDLPRTKGTYQFGRILGLY